jgi:competence protein ComEA
LSNVTSPPIRRPPARFARWLARCLISGLSILLVPGAAAQQRSDKEHPEGRWEILEGCRLATNAPLDGDSFHVLHAGREYIFRLYFVDTPEIDPKYEDRAQDQAAYFGISTNEIPSAGRRAAEFTRKALAGQKFRVDTRWQNAMGMSRLPRFYGVVLVDGNNLAEELVANGLARIYGLRANWPEGQRSATLINRLKNRELAAREQKRGIWDEQAFPRSDAAPGRPAGPKPAPVDKTLVDLNGATLEELQKLPGIKRLLAERIISQRPYRKVDDLAKVRGIGPKSMERLRPLVRVQTD